MKKFFKISLILAVFAVVSLFTATAHASDSVKSTYVQTYDGVTYTCVDTFHSAELNKSEIKTLPDSLTNDGFIYSFAIYKGKIYYITGVKGSSDVIGSIYRCNLDGSENELIANDATASACFFLSEDCLFYPVLNDYDNNHKRNLSGGIMKIYLPTGAYRKIITDRNVTLRNVLNNNVFYQVGDGSHLMNTMGAYIGGLSPNDVEIAADVIVGATAYMAYLGDVYAHDWSWNKTFICNLADYVNGNKVNSYSGEVVNVTGGYVYYYVTYTAPNYHLNPDNTALFKAPLSGGTSTLVATWYKS